MSSVDPSTQGEQSIALAWAVTRHWRLILVSCFLGLAIGLAAYLLLPKNYRAEATVATTEGDVATSGLGSQFAQLAGIAGLSFSTSATAYRQEAVSTLRSRSVAKDFIQEYDLAGVIGTDTGFFAPRPAPGKQDFNDEQLNRITRDFLDRVLSVREDRRTGMIVVSVTWHDPVVAAAWANGIVRLADERLRNRQHAESDKNLALLEEVITKTALVELRQTLYHMYQFELERKLQSQVRDAVFFRVVDPAVPPDPRKPFSPDLTLFLVTGVLSGLAVGIGAAVLLRQRSWRRR